MPATKPKSSQLTEFEQVTRWRFDELIALGLTPVQAISFVEVPDIVHTVRKLVDRGCPPEIVVSLLGD